MLISGGSDCNVKVWSIADCYNEAESQPVPSLVSTYAIDAKVNAVTTTSDGVIIVGDVTGRLTIINYSHIR